MKSLNYAEKLVYIAVKYETWLNEQLICYAMKPAVLDEIAPELALIGSSVLIGNARFKKYLNDKGAHPRDFYDEAQRLTYPAFVERGRLSGKTKEVRFKNGKGRNNPLTDFAAVLRFERDDTTAEFYTDGHRSQGSYNTLIFNKDGQILHAQEIHGKKRRALAPNDQCLEDFEANHVEFLACLKNPEENFAPPLFEPHRAVQILKSKPVF